MSLTGDVYAIELLVFPNDNPMAHRSAFSGETPLVSSLMALLKGKYGRYTQGTSGEENKYKGC